MASKRVVMIVPFYPARRGTETPVALPETGSGPHSERDRTLVIAFFAMVVGLAAIVRVVAAIGKRR